jgi:hypothetical protein
MKGYLERLAASASRPQSRLRPVVGSIFAEGRREEIEDVALPAVSEQASERKAAQPTPQTETSRSAQEPGAINAEDHPRKPQPIREKPAAFSPLLPPKSVEVNPDASRVAETRTGNTAMPHLQSSQAAPRIEHPEHKLEMPMQLRGDISDPLLPSPSALEKREAKRNTEASSQAAEIRMPAVEPLNKPITRVAYADSREMMPAPRAPVRDKTEEIQIHIGRIEVIAVPPPAVRSAAIPTNRFTSLDDYLKRRDGHAR